MSPKAFIVIDDGSVTESVVVGDTPVEVVVLDFDSIEMDPDEARQILADYGSELASIHSPAGARDLRDRLQDIVDEADEEDRVAEIEEELDEEMEELENDEDFDDEDDEDDEKKESDYADEHEFNRPPPGWIGHHADEPAGWGFIEGDD